MIINNDQLDSLLMKTWMRVGSLPEVAEASKISEEEVIREIFSREELSKSSAEAAVDFIKNNPDFLSQPQLTGKRETGRYNLFEKIKETLDVAFEEIPLYDSIFLDFLFEQTPASFEREKTRLDEKVSPIEALFIRTGRNLTKLNLYTDTGVYIMDKALRKIASANSEDGSITERGSRRILHLTRKYELSYYAYEDTDGKHFLKDTVKELVGEPRYNSFLQEETKRQEAEYTRKLEEKSVDWRVHRARALALAGFWDK